MRIRFLKTVSVPPPDGRSYKEGKIYDLPDASALRWLRRNVAVIVDETRTSGTDIIETASVDGGEKTVRKRGRPRKVK